MPCVSEVTPSTASIDFAQRERSKPCDCPDCKAAKVSASNFFDLATRSASSVPTPLPATNPPQPSPFRPSDESPYEPNFIMSSLILPGGGMKGHDDGDKFHPHTKHVVNDSNGNPVREVISRLEREPDTQKNSTFYNRAIAEHVGAKLILAEEAKIKSWLDSDSDKACVLSGTVDGGVGRSFKRGGKDAFRLANVSLRYNIEADMLIMVLQRDASKVEGYRIETFHVDGNEDAWKPPKKPKKS